MCWLANYAQISVKKSQTPQKTEKQAGPERTIHAPSQSVASAGRMGVASWDGAYLNLLNLAGKNCVLSITWPRCLIIKPYEKSTHPFALS
jgi:hypothetical protein